MSKAVTRGVICGAAWMLMACGAFADLPEGLTYDDGYAYFQVDTHEESVDGKRVATGWTLMGQLRVLGRAPGHSLFRMVVKKDGAEVANVRQEANVYYYEPPAQTDHEDSMWWDRVGDRNLFIQGTGEYQVEVWFVDGNDLTEHLARTHTIDVEKVTRVRGNGDPDADHYYVDRHAEAAASVIQQRRARLRPYGMDGGEYYDRNVVDITFGISASPDGRNLDRGYMRATVNGEALDLTGKSEAVDGDLLYDRFYEVVHSAAGNVKEAINFRQMFVTLPLTWGAEGEGRDSNKVAIDDHPGDWVVRYIVNGEAVRTWRFTVTPEGTIAPHPEEAYGLTFAQGAHMVEVELPPGGSYIDERLVPARTSVGAFYGHAWMSPGAQAFASAIPQKGTPAP